MASVILVCGLNGAGKSTLAKALAERLNLRFIDIEDIYFSRQDNPDYPYEKARPYEEVVSMLTNIVNGENDFVLALTQPLHKDGLFHTDNPDCLDEKSIYLQYQ